MLINCVLVISCVWWGGVVADQASVTLQDNGFDGVLIAINPTIAEDPRIITNIKNMFTRASPTLFTATKKRAYFRNINILVPKTWTNGSYNEAIGLSYSKADVIIAQANPQKGNIPYSEHTGGCGEYGRFIHLTPEYVVDNMEQIFGDVEKVLVHEWAHIRWGVFDEYATEGHSSHYVDTDGVLQGTSAKSIELRDSPKPILVLSMFTMSNNPD
ncbi:calcium-activated chloride channel regulator family member 3-like [Ciona intestinalis]